MARKPKIFDQTFSKKPQKSFDFLGIKNSMGIFDRLGCIAAYYLCLRFYLKTTEQFIDGSYFVD